MSFLTTIVNFFESTALSIWSKVSGSINIVINEIPDAEAQILHDAMAQFSTDLHAGKSFGEAAADAWTLVKNAEAAELGRVGTHLLEAFIAQLEPKKPVT